MFTKSASVLVAAAFLLSGAAQNVHAQPNYGPGNYGPGNYGQGNFGQGNYGNTYGQRGYDDGYRDGYRRGWDTNRNRGRFDDQIPLPPPTMYEDANTRWQRQYQRSYSYRDDGYYRECRNSVDPGGVIAGALIGGILGNALGGRHGGGGSTIAGVVLGGAMGAVLTKGLDCDDRSYAYNSYYNGFNAGRVGVPYQWRNPGSGHYGEFRVDGYYNDPVGFRCANFTQQIWIGGTPQAATGRACQQPDGTWAIVG